MRQMLPILLVTALAMPSAMATTEARGMRTAPADAKDSATADWVARRRKRKRGGKSKSSSKVPSVPVKIRTGDSKSATLKKGRKSHQVWLVTPEAPMSLEVQGPGKLALVIHQVLPTSKAARKKLNMSVIVDGGTPAALSVLGKPMRKGKLKGGATPMVSNPKKHLIVVKGGAHTIDIKVPDGSFGAAIKIEHYPTGFKKAAPVIVEAAKPSGMMAGLDDLDDDDDDDFPTPPTAVPDAPPAPPPVDPATDDVTIDDAPPAPDAPSPGTDIAAAPVDVTPPGETPEQALTRRLTAGEVRDGMLGEWPGLTVAHKREEKRNDFFRVPQEKSFVVMVAGPGELTIRLHRLIDPGTAATAEGSEYSIVILENDVVLQQLTGITASSQSWAVAAGGAADGLLVSDPKEYRLKVSARQSKLALQISEAPEGMAIRYDFSAETASLAALDLSFDDDEDEDDDDIGSIAAAPKPTVVMEVAIKEKIIIESKQEFIGLAVLAGTVFPAAGGDPMISAAADVRFALPFASGALTVGVRAGYNRHTLQRNVADLDGVVIRARSRTDMVPILGNISYRLALGESFALYAHAGAGVSYVRAMRRALGAETVATGWPITALGGAGFEVDVGVGWMGIDGGYLYALPGDFGDSLAEYAPSGPLVALQYRIGI